GFLRRLPRLDSPYAALRSRFAVQTEVPVSGPGTAGREPLTAVRAFHSARHPRLLHRTGPAEKVDQEAKQGDINEKLLKNLRGTATKTILGNRSPRPNAVTVPCAWGTIVM